MNTTAQMFKQWGVVKDVRVLPNPDYMHRDESLPRALRGTSADEVSQRAAHRDGRCVLQCVATSCRVMQRVSQLRIYALR